MLFFKQLRNQKLILQCKFEETVTVNLYCVYNISLLKLHDTTFHVPFSPSVSLVWYLDITAQVFGPDTYKSIDKVIFCYVMGEQKWTHVNMSKLKIFLSSGLQ